MSDVSVLAFLATLAGPLHFGLFFLVLLVHRVGFSTCALVPSLLRCWLASSSALPTLLPGGGHLLLQLQGAIQATAELSSGPLSSLT